MNAATMTQAEIRQQGIAALAQQLGPVGMIRFLQQFETGRGDYSVERHQWLPDDLEAIARDLARRNGDAGESAESGPSERGT